MHRGSKMNTLMKRARGSSRNWAAVVGLVAMVAACDSDSSDPKCGPGTKLNAEGTGCDVVLSCGPGTEPNTNGDGCQAIVAPNPIVCTNGYVLDTTGTGCICPETLVPSADGTACVTSVPNCGTGSELNEARDACVAIPGFQPANPPDRTLRVIGLVTDRHTGVPIAGATVHVYPLREEDAITDENGYFDIEGDLVTGDYHIVYTAEGYVYQHNVFDPALAGDVERRVDLSVGLERIIGTLDVVGVVYAEDAPAPDVTADLVRIAGPGTGFAQAHIAYSTTAGDDGEFRFEGVLDARYELHIGPHDKDGDGILDYRGATDQPARFSTRPLSQLGQLEGINVSNIVVQLPQIQQRVLATSFIPDPASVALEAGVALANLTLPGTDSNIVFHFGAEADPSALLIELALHHNVAGQMEGDIPVAVTPTWSRGDSVLTIDPDRALVADIDTFYTLRILSFAWSDGSVAIPPGEGTLMQFRFTVDPSPIVEIESPAELNFHLDAHRATPDEPYDQVATQVVCDEAACWYLDEAGYPFRGYPGLPDVDAWAYANGLAGFQFTWPHVAGTTEYRLYARRVPAGMRDVADDLPWWPLDFTYGSGPVDPFQLPNVWADDVFENAGDGVWRAWFDNTLGPLAFDAEVDVGVAGLDGLGRQAPMVPAAYLTLSDERPASVHSATVDVVNDQATVRFTEHMNTTGAVTLSAVSGYITDVGSDALQVSWADTPPVGQNVSHTVSLDGVGFALRGQACQPITCDALVDPSGSGAAQPVSDNRICVRDASVFADRDPVFFVDADGAPQHINDGPGPGRADDFPQPLLINQNGVDLVHNDLTFASLVVDDLPFGEGVTQIYACNMNGATVTTRRTVPGDTTLAVQTPSIFYPGGRIVIFDTDGGQMTDLLVTTVTHVTTTTSSIRIADPISPTWALGAAVLPFAPEASAYEARRATRPVIRSVAPNQTIAFDMIDTDDRIMVGDLVLVDIDGYLDTTDDRGFATVSVLVMEVDRPATAADENDYHVVLGAPLVGMPALPGATVVQRDESLVIFLGDSFVVNAAELVDTSGNAGLDGFRSRFSLCPAGGIVDRVGQDACQDGTLVF